MYAAKSLTAIALLGSLLATPVIRGHADDDATIPAGPAISAKAEPPVVCSVRGVAITVSDLDRAVEFYTKVLRFELESTEDRSGDAVEHLVGVFGARLRVATLKLGDERIELCDYVAAEGRPFPPDSKANDLWFQHVAIVVSDMSAAYRVLASHGVVHASSAPQRLPDWNPNAGGIEAFYFRDPDRHWLELIHFPRGKGDARWQVSGDRLFLGIDHTAIVVDDTDRALEFWRDRLGLVVAGGSENHGVEQEHLNGVFGARLRITTLRTANGALASGADGAAGGIGVELLDYLSPCDGRATNEDLRASDLVHWFTLLETSDSRPIVDATRANRPLWISPGTVDLGDGRAALTLRDPDRHGVEVRTKSAAPATTHP